MKRRREYTLLPKKLMLCLLLALTAYAIAQHVKVVTNRVGYEFDKPNHTILVAEVKLPSVDLN